MTTPPGFGLSTPPYGQPNFEYAMRSMSTPAENDGPILMVNLMRYHERAVYADGDRGLSGREADDKYAPFEVLRDIGADIVFTGNVDVQLMGTPTWDRIGCVQYPTRRSFFEMQSRPDFQALHEHKAAGMAQTIVMGCTAITMPERADDLARTDWAEVEHPPTTDDPPIVVMHVIRFSEDVGEVGMDGYHDAAFQLASRHGARIGGWYNVEGTIVGDGRAWDQVRFNIFPSKAAFIAVATDPARLEAQRAHREPAIADTYAIVIRPVINQLPGAQ